MASLLQKSLVFLGLVDEEHLESDDTVDAPVAPPRHAETPQPADPARRPERSMVIGNRGSEVRGRRVEPPAVARRTVEHAGTRQQGTPSAVRAVPTADAQSDIIEVKTFDHAKLLADRIRDRTPVVLDLRATDPDMVRRIIDFSTGLTYALDGSMRKIADGVILVSPPRVSIGREEKRRLASLGLFDLDIDPR